NENTQNQISNAIRELKVGKLLRRANITKTCGISAYEVFQFLLLLVFQGKNLFRFLNSKRKDLAVSKNTYYRFLLVKDVETEDIVFFFALSAGLLYKEIGSDDDTLSYVEKFVFFQIFRIHNGYIGGYCFGIVCCEEIEVLASQKGCNMKHFCNYNEKTSSGVILFLSSKRVWTQ
ncbi:MAG: hypothetical protein HFI92_12820, partial [Lachnospiraceae bacterium]|nr:hypothetical protein [Lachnospiraceae bacterium]